MLMAIALTNALPQVQQLWQMPKIGGYLNRFANATQWQSSSIVLPARQPGRTPMLISAWQRHKRL
jgi:hypothetical protein